MSVLLALAAVGGSACGTLDARWAPLEARQIAVPLVAGTNVVRVRDLKDGWTEEIVVESDGSKATGGIPTEIVPLPADAALDPESTRYFRDAVGGRIPPNGDTIARAYALCLWVGDRTYGRAVRRDGASEDEPLALTPVVDATGDGRATLEGIEAGGKIGCVSLAKIFVDVARAHGLAARRVDLGVRHLSPNEAHATAEVWLPEHSRWVVVDPTFSMYFTVDGVPAGALDLQSAVLDNRFERVRVVRDARARGVDPSTYQINPLLYFRNVYYRVLPDPKKWLSAADARTPPSPVAEAGIAQTESTALLNAPPGAPRELVTATGRVDGRLAYQVLHGRLYVCLIDGLFERGRFEVSHSSPRQPEVADATPGYDPGDSIVGAPDEYASNPTLADADGDGVPDGWQVDEGGAQFTRDSAGPLVVETGDAQCAISRREPAAEGLPLVAAVVTEVERGAVEFSIRQRREGDALRLAPGPLAVYSPVLLRPKPERLRLRFVFAPNTRCRLVRISLRRERLLGELVGPPVEPGDHR